MLSSKALKDLVAEARPIIERQLDDAERIAAFREVVASNGGDWSALKALIKAQIQDERDETGNGKRVKKILEKADFSTGYADMLGWSNMNEKNFSAEEEFDPITGEFIEDGEANPKLIAAVAAGMQTEIGRKALVTALDIMIEREEAEEIHANPEEAGARGETVSAPAVDAGSRPVAGRSATATSEIMDVTGGERAATPCEYCNGSGDVHRIDGEWLGRCHCEAGKYPSDHGVISAAAANAGGENVESSAPRAGQVPTSNPGEGAASALPAKSRLRPHCRNPGEKCGGYGDKHCHDCLRAMRESEAA